MLRNLGNNTWLTTERITTSQLCAFLKGKSEYIKLYYNKGSSWKETDDLIYEYDGLYSVNTLDCIYSREKLTPIEAMKYVQIQDLTGLLRLLNKKVILPGNITTTFLKISWRHIRVGDFDIKYDIISNLSSYLEIAYFIQNNFPTIKRLRPFSRDLINYIPKANLQYYHKLPTVYLEIMTSEKTDVLPLFSSLEVVSPEDPSVIYKLVFIQ